MLPLPPTAVVAVTDAARKVVAVLLGSEVQATLPVPKGGGVLAGIGAAGDFLRATATLGTNLTVDRRPQLCALRAGAR